MEGKKRTAKEVIEYFEGTLQKGDVVIHIGRTTDGTGTKVFYFAEVE